jgi:ABC-type transport system involved in cytochrome c biogenesis permease subunit
VADYAWGRFWGWGPEGNLVARDLGRLRGLPACSASTAAGRATPAAWLAIIGVITFWFNFIGINLLVSGLHSYAGI